MKEVSENKRNLDKVKKVPVFFDIKIVFFRQ